MLYISERIVNIHELEKQIQNAKLHFNILKKELRNTAPSEIIDGAVYQIDRSLKAAEEFEFRLEQRTCEITNVSEISCAVSDGVRKAVEQAIHDTDVKAPK